MVLDHMLTHNSAGVRDSPLTSHGHLQAERLGKYLAQRGLRCTHIFCSDLQRAEKTAKAIYLAQKTTNGGNISSRTFEVLPLKVLREQDFGFYEGKPFYARPRDSNKSGKDSHRSQHQDDPNFKDVESKEAMDARMDQYLKEHLLPVVKSNCHESDVNVVVVSHGIILSHLWRCLLKCFAPNSIALSPDLSFGTSGVVQLEYLGGWSNTGYLELHITNHASLVVKEPTPPSERPIVLADTTSLVDLSDYKMVIKAVNGKEHLSGLKRTRGVSSSRFDEGQKKIESFFKKQKT